MTSKRSKLIIIALGVIASCGSGAGDRVGFSEKDGAFYTDDAVIINGM